MTDTLVIDAALKNRVQGYIQPRVPPKDAEDVISDAWLRIVKNWGKYDPTINPVVWVWAKYHCKSAVADYYRRHQDHQEYQDGQTSTPPSPIPSDYEQLLEVAFTAADKLHQQIAFGYVGLLEWKPSGVVTDLSDNTLEDLGNRFTMDYASRFPHQRSQALELLNPFSERVRNKRTRFAEFYLDPKDSKQCAAEVGRWKYTVLRRLTSDLKFLGGLESILTTNDPLHERILQGHIKILGETEQTLATQYPDESPKSLAERLEKACINKRPHLSRLLQRLFRPLHQKGNKS